MVPDGHHFAGEDADGDVQGGGGVGLEQQRRGERSGQRRHFPQTQVDDGFLLAVLQRPPSEVSDFYVFLRCDGGVYDVDGEGEVVDDAQLAARRQLAVVRRQEFGRRDVVVEVATRHRHLIPHAGF